MAPDPLDKLLEVIRRLRGPDGCPWDRKQTQQSLVPHTLEEAYELVDAVRRADPEAIREELGDLLFLLVFHAALGEDTGAFDFNAVICAVTDKLVRRHPAVFGPQPAAEGEPQWEAAKTAERRAGDRDRSALAGVADALPALVRAVKLQERAACDGFDWPDREGALDKLDEELAELRSELAGADQARLEHELGDVLLAVTNVARHLGVDPETALRLANRRFEQRYARMEQLAAATDGRRLADASLAEMEVFWQQAKRQLDEP